MSSNLKIFLIVVTLFVSSSVYSQDILVKGEKKIGSVDISGIVKDGLENQIGEITALGQVKNHLGDVVGNIVGNKFINADGLTLGEKRNVDGEVQILMAGEHQFGIIQSGNQIIEMSGQIILSSTGSVTETQLLAYFFFF